MILPSQLLLLAQQIRHALIVKLELRFKGYF